MAHEAFGEAFDTLLEQLHDIDPTLCARWSSMRALVEINEWLGQSEEAVAVLKRLRAEMGKLLEEGKTREGSAPEP